MARNSGYLVQLSDGKVGRTYAKEGPVNGKIRVYVIAESWPKMTEGKFLPENERPQLLCSPDKIKIMGMVD